jgi:hypothetical protein
MAFENNTGGILDYYPYRLGRSRLMFRGPRPRIDGAYVTVLGGSEAYGKFVTDPFPSLLESRLGLPVINFGCMHAGVAAFSDEDAVLAACAEAEVSVIQIMGAANMSNRLYSVHPRRNDRFLKASAALRSLYPQVDFTEYNFTRHLLSALEARDAAAFIAVRAELREAWLGRMRLLIRKIGGRVVLLWMSHRRPEDADASPSGGDPLFIDRGMIDALSGEVADYVEVVASADAREEGLDHKIYAPVEALAAQEVPGPLFHAEVAGTLAQRIPPLLELKRPGEGITGPREGLSEPFRAFR